MTHFLEVGSMREELQEIFANAQQLYALLSMTPEQREAMDQSLLQQGELTTHAQSVRQTLIAVLEQTDGLIQFLDQFESAPIIYTGEGSTAEVLGRLERLMSLARSEGADL
jgi:hypothetical protein